jgi:threonylcarbamoyladenosine tRNA methylthiotransferase MtaB
MKIALYTLGCRTNQAESAGMAELLRLRGHDAVNPGEDETDAVIINTCTVTATADKKSRNAIRKLRAQYPDALLAVCGCLPQTDGLKIEGIDLIGGTSGREAFITALEAKQRGNMIPAIPDEYEDTLPDARPIGRSRAYIKIQDGCDNKCAYCKVPQARGKSRSRTVEGVIQAARRAAEDGAIEIVLTGIEISSYTPSLAGLTVQVCRAVNPVPVRLSSLHPEIIDREFASAMKAESNFRPVFHLSLQSCCDKILSAMGRRYTVREIFSAFDLLRGRWDDVEITADIIAGFPGEDEPLFTETLQNLQKLKPDGLHVFPYSRRKGTAAADLPAQNTRAVKTERVRKLMEAFPNQRSAD